MAGMAPGAYGDFFERVSGGHDRGATTHTRTARRDRARQGAGRARRGDTSRRSVEIDLADAYHGVEKQVTVTRSEACPACDGQGYRAGETSRTCPKCSGEGHMIHVRDTSLGRSKRREPCDRCEGTGETDAETCTRCGGDGQERIERTLAVEIPAGIESGQTLRLRDRGDVGSRGGPPGDLLVDVQVTDHPRFDRDGANLHRPRALSYPQAALGDTVQIPRFEDPVEVRIPAGTKSGETFRLEGEGLPYRQQSGRGTLYVHTDIVTPEELTEPQRRALRAFADASTPEDTEDVR